MFVVMTAFFNYQSDDEVYFGASEYIGIPEEADYTDGVITIDDTMGIMSGSVVAETPAIHIDAGDYILDVDHQGDQDIEAIIYDGNNEIESVILPYNELNSRIHFSTSKNLYNLSVRYIYSGKGIITIKRSILYSTHGPFYTDTLIYTILLIVGVCMLVFIAIRMDVFNMSTRDKLWFGMIIGYLLLINYMYYRPFPIVAEDTRYHLARIEATYNEMRQGQFPIILYSDFVQGKRMVGIMYPYLLLLIPALLRMMHGSPEGSLRLFFIFITYATCATSYFASKRLMKNRYMATVAMMLYGMLIYRITTMTYRYAYGELQAFIFFPLVICGLYEVLVGDRNKWIILSLGMTGLMQCHLLSFIQAAALCGVFGMIYIVIIIRERRILQIIIAAFATILLNLWHIIPFLTYYRDDLGIKDHLSWGKEIYVTGKYFSRNFGILFSRIRGI